jgi:hypothetical protein
MINRTKALVLALFAAYWLTVVTILVAARDVYDQVLDQTIRVPAGDQRLAEIAVLLVLTALLGLLSTGVIRGWRWTFWLILVVFMAGILHVLVSALQLVGAMAKEGPGWYVLLQLVVGLIQFVIALAMLAGYRRAGLWGTF